LTGHAKKPILNQGVENLFQSIQGKVGRAVHGRIGMPSRFDRPPTCLALLNRERALPNSEGFRLPPASSSTCRYSSNLPFCLNNKAKIGVCQAFSSVREKIIDFKGEITYMNAFKTHLKVGIREQP
jgi:hypothetical protein